ncbi:MAG TPA: M15 family metallopeptidase [Chitinophagaceae bacterium]
MKYDRDPKYLHPYISSRLQTILDAINAKLPPNHSAKLVSAHRTPADQFLLFKQGRTFKNGAWVKTGSVVTNLDGFVKLSRHNYLACTAFDVGIFDGNNYLGNSNLYKHVKEGSKQGMDWGGDWVSFIDQPHLEIPPSQFFKSNIQKDSGLIWQQYLRKAGTYNKALDGIFGAESHKALKAATGEDSRNLTAWDKLFAQFGVMKDYLII